MATTDSGACHPPNPIDADHFLVGTGIGGRHQPELLGGVVTLDNSNNLWQATSFIFIGGRNVTGKVIHAENWRSASIEMGM
jgi:hypothetical protein